MTDQLRKSVLKKLADGDYSCPKEFTLSMFSGKWKINIIYHLGQDGAYYFGELQKLLPTASHKMIAEKLKELVSDGIVSRQEISGPRIKVKYTLTNLGKSLLPIINAMYDWGTERIQQLQVAHVKFNLGEVKPD
ncbi:Transcriptional regulator, HxlR family [Pediococcus damnosus]|uniref:Transcriptional regulator, HxlR family n=1 Tax=Pediococcus damnosus TaxID=51663 RepID=A0A0R2HMI2_9LACO|nr:helix-turn-helix domain-containing protein [Pediococcus damnosus]AMV63076.1 Transcriptional regulator, HxlR family [Pediococcus damnosus]AMV64770.1 Transcriptional regulator, HxlR family [Pediococcus damnosus]AMV67033.1 Transcriptional regulator, HxlR family [Pediococcus damnosus]AMV69364.1 Transcriptional regulator, HxlR family [Pediococcus damnosus]KJU74382.1 HxlR family transcriptional regulator [Pediococcus damnosus LMG 28219]